MSQPEWSAPKPPKFPFQQLANTLNASLKCPACGSGVAKCVDKLLLVLSCSCGAFCLSYQEALIFMGVSSKLIELIKSKMHHALDIAMNTQHTFKVTPDHTYIMSIDPAHDESFAAQYQNAIMPMGDPVFKVVPTPGIAEMFMPIDDKMIDAVFPSKKTLSNSTYNFQKLAELEVKTYLALVYAKSDEADAKYYASDLGLFQGDLKIPMHPGKPTHVAKESVQLDDLTPALAEFMSDYIE